VTLTKSRKTSFPIPRQHSARNPLNPISCLHWSCRTRSVLSPGSILFAELWDWPSGRIVRGHYRFSVSKRSGRRTRIRTRFGGVAPHHNESVPAV